VKAVLDTVLESARSLDRSEQGKLVGILLDELSKGIADHSDDDLDEIASQREEEMEANPEMVVSHEEMLAHIASRRKS
jgi:hypothetical protein